MKFYFKEKAINLRKQGLSYSEILDQIPVAKSTLSLWLRSVNLSKRQKQRLAKKRLVCAQKGGDAKRKQKIELIQRITQQSIKEIRSISKRELWLIGIALYWAEGSKEKEYKPGSPAQFTNSDPEMIRLFLRWLEKINIIKEDILIEIYIHENSKNNIDSVKKYWSNITHFPISHFKRIYFKKNKIKTNRKNTKESYFGLIRIKIKKSSVLNRRIAGWINGVVESLNIN